MPRSNKLVRFVILFLPLNHTMTKITMALPIITVLIMTLLIMTLHIMTLLKMAILIIMTLLITLINATGGLCVLSTVISKVMHK